MSVTYLLQFYFCLITSTKTHERYLHILISCVDDPSNPNEVENRFRHVFFWNTSYLKTPFSYAC